VLIAPRQLWLPTNFTVEELTVEVLVNVSHRPLVLTRMTPSTGPSTGSLSCLPFFLDFREIGLHTCSVCCMIHLHIIVLHVHPPHLTFWRQVFGCFDLQR